MFSAKITWNRNALDIKRKHDEVAVEKKTEKAVVISQQKYWNWCIAYPTDNNLQFQLVPFTLPRWTIARNPFHVNIKW